MILTKDTFKVIASKAYTNELCTSTEEFNADLRVFDKVLRLLRKIERGKEANIRLLVNNLIILYNNFETKAVVDLLMFKAMGEVESQAKTVLYYLNLMTDHDATRYTAPMDERLLVLLTKELKP